MSKKFPGGVITGDAVQAIFDDAQDNEYALPAVNVVGTSSINAVLETAAQVNSPVMVQFSNGEECSTRAKAFPTKRRGRGGGVGLGSHARLCHGQGLRRPVILHTDHAARKLFALGGRDA